MRSDMIRFARTPGVNPMASVVATFINWWNRLASRTGKAKFRTEREAFEFIQHTYRESGGPNAEIRAMREEYEEIRRTRASRQIGSDEGRNRTVVA